MPTLTQNPNLTDWDGTTQYLEDWTQDDTVKKVAIEKPTHWQYRYQNQYEGQHPNRVPQSLHVENEGFKIAAGYFQWHAGYAQRVSGLEAGKRYLLKVVYRNHLSDTDDPQAVGCRGEIFGQTPLYGDFQFNPAVTMAGAELTYLLPFEMAGNGDIEVAFMTQNTWGEGATDVVISYIGLEPVREDYGGANVPVVVPIGTTTLPGDTPDETPDDSPTGDTEPEGSSISLTLYLNLSGEVETAFAEFWLALARWVDRQ